MQRKHPLWFLLPLAFLLSLAACSSQAPAADAPQEAAAYTVAPYTPTEQEQTLLQAYELTQDNTVAFTFQNPEEILGLFVQIYRLGEDGTWKNVDEIAVGSLLPPQAEGLITLQLEDSEAIIARVLCQGSLQVGSAGPLEGDFVARTQRFLTEPQPIQRNEPIPIALLAYAEAGNPTAQDDALGKISLQDFFTPENLTGLDQVQAVTVTFSSDGGGLLPFPWFVGEVCFFLSIHGIIGHCLNHQDPDKGGIPMANRVTIYIHNQSYNFLAEEDASYLQQCADIVNKEMDEAMSGTTISLTDGAVLAAMNVADKYCKERAVSDNLRAQLKQALDENARLARELSEAKREGRKASRGGRPPKQPPAEPAKPAGEEG